MDGSDRLRKHDYETLANLAKGAFGQVYSGYLCATGQSVIIKKGKRASLEKEYLILKDLASKSKTARSHIVKVFGWDVDGDNFLIIMERGKHSLAHLLNRPPYKSGLPAVDMVKLIADLGSAFGLLIDYKVSHRDIKPHNILVFEGSNDPSKSQFMFKLCDFGTARGVLEDEGCHTIAGTPQYLHPEIYIEYLEHPQRFRTDVPYKAEMCDMWSMAVTLYVSATGDLPWPQVMKDETKILHRRRPAVATSAAHNPNGGYIYYESLRTPSYPRWLNLALASLIRSQYNTPSYETFLSQCRYIAEATGEMEGLEQRKVTQKRLFLMPSLTPSMHVDVDEKLFPNASLNVQSLFNLPANSQTACLTDRGVTVFGAGVPISINAIKEDKIIIWNENGQGLTSNPGNIPPLYPPSSAEEKKGRCVEECYEINRRCDELIEAYHAISSITRRNVDRVVSKSAELSQWIHSIERNEEQAATISAMAGLVEPRHREMLSALDAAPRETKRRREEVRGFVDRAAALAECTRAWTILPERPIENWNDSLHQIISSRGESQNDHRMRRFAETMRTLAQQRLRALEDDCNSRVAAQKNGIAIVIRNLVKLDSEIHESVRKMKETASLVSTIADAARVAVVNYMKGTVGMDEAKIRMNLTNSVQLASFLKRNVKHQAAIVKQMEEAMQNVSMLSIRKSSTETFGENLTGTAMQNGNIEDSSLQTLTPRNSF